jgi:hypothetical protein
MSLGSCLPESEYVCWTVCWWQVHAVRDESVCRYADATCVTNHRVDSVPGARRYSRAKPSTGGRVR